MSVIMLSVTILRSTILCFIFCSVMLGFVNLNGITPVAFRLIFLMMSAINLSFNMLRVLRSPFTECPNDECRNSGCLYV